MRSRVGSVYGPVEAGPAVRPSSLSLKWGQNTHSRRRVRAFVLLSFDSTLTLNPVCLVMGEHSEESQQHASSECGNAVAQSVLASIPVRLASRFADAAAGRGRAARRREREDDGSRAAPRSAFSTWA